jgi:hypothetical protein
MKCTLDTINQYRTIINTANNIPYIAQSQAENLDIDLQDKKFWHVDQRGRHHEIPLYDKQDRKINYMKKRNFLVKAHNLPK